MSDNVWRGEVGERMDMCPRCFPRLHPMADGKCAVCSFVPPPPKPADRMRITKVDVEARSITLTGVDDDE